MFFQRAELRLKLHRWRAVGRWMRTGGVRRKLLIFLVLVVGLVALAPFIVAKTPLRNMLLSAALPGDALRIRTNGASFSWKNGASLSSVEVRDAAGESMLYADKISIDRAPGNLLMHPRDLGTIEITKPTIYIQLRPDGSNIEDAIQKLLSDLAPMEPAPESDSESQPFEYSVLLTEGTVRIKDAASGRQWRIEKLDVRYTTLNSSKPVVFGSLSGELVQTPDAAAPMPAGRFSMSFKPDDAGINQLTWQAEGVSLVVAEPMLRRVIAAGELNGTLSGQGTASWSNATTTVPGDLTSTGMLAIDRLDASAPSLSGDRIRLARVDLPWRVTSQPGGLMIDDLRLRSDVCQVAVRGRLDRNFAAAQHDMELRGSVDIARLAAMLPRALGIRENTKITSGTIELAGRYQPSEGGQLITGSVRSTQLAATRAGKDFQWDQPVNANFALRRTGSAMQLDALHCDSQFLNIDAAGNLQQFSANASFDINRLGEQLGQFLDLRGTKLAGTGSAKLVWQQIGVNQFNATATGDLAALSVSLGNGDVWAEPQLAIRAEAAGLLDTASHWPTRVDTAKLQVSGQGDALDAQLTGVVSMTDAAPAWPVAIRASGRIARWLTRARPFFSPGDWQIDGQSELTTNVRLAGQAFEASQSKLVVTDLRATGPGWNIHEPRVVFDGDARWDGAKNEVVANSAQLVTSTVSLRAQNVRYCGGEQAINQLTGVAAFRADLGRLASWRQPANEPAPYRAQGELTGNVRFAQQGDRITGELTATGQNLALASLNKAATPGYQTTWQEPNLTLRGVASYESSSDRLAFDQLQIQSNTLQAAAGGSIEKLSTAADINVNGTFNYDLAQATPLLRPYIGEGIQLTGREQARFVMAGKLSDDSVPKMQLTATTTSDPYRLATATTSSSATHWSRRVRAQLELPWSGANVYGLPVGAGRLAANLGDGSLRIEPLALAVGEGQLTAAPQVRFDPEPAELTMPAGPLITNVRISPEVSEAMLKYVAPVLAGATQSEGKFSLQLDGTRVPLADTKRTDAAGQLSVHQVRVVPGAMARELIGVAQQVEALAKRRDPTALATRPNVTLLNIKDQQVNFRVVEGRVHHQNMEFQVGDITMRSQGSVGFDQTVQLTLHVPIQNAWVEKEPLLAGLKGQSLQVPVSGTLTRPQLDKGAIASLSQQLLQGAAQKAIGGELNKALDKLFKPR